MEKTQLLEAIWENHEANTVLDPREPVPSVNVSVYPAHLTIALPDIVYVFAFIDVAALPMKFPVTILLISSVFSFKLIAIPNTSRAVSSFNLFAPLALAMLHSIKEFPRICVSIQPLVLTETIWIAVSILSNVLVTI